MDIKESQKRSTTDIIGWGKGLANLAGSMPKLQMANNPHGDYALMNWEEVKVWGWQNHPLWNYVHKSAEAHGWDEVTTLKVLADALMR